MIKFFVLLLLASLCHAAPSPSNAATCKLLEKPQRARCLSSLFGKMFDFSDSYSLPDDVPLGMGSSGFGGGLHGGMMGPSSSFGGTGLGLPSQFTPGLGQASGALHGAYGLENQMYGAQAQLAGVPGSGFPMSSGFVRSYGQQPSYLPAPPSYSG